MPLKPCCRFGAVAFLSAYVFAPAAGNAQATAKDCRQQATLVTELGERVRFAKPFSSESQIEDVPPSAPHPGARYLRVRLEATNVAGCDWLLTVRDSEYRVVQTMNASDFARGSKRWTTRILGARAYFDLQRCKDGRPDIKFDEYIAMPSEAKFPYYSTQGDAPLYRPLYSGNHPFRRLGDSVGLLMSSWGRQSWVCSGVMITRDLFMTNWHCGGPARVLDARGGWRPFQTDGYWNDSIVNDSIIDLSFDTDQVSREYTVSEVVAQSQELDFAILRVARLDALGDARSAPISLSPPKAGAIVIIHHPEGKPKHVTLGCQIAQVEYPGWRGGMGLDFTHVCDTEAGSSGAPIFNLQGEVVGLHHLGFAFDTDSCRQTDQVNKAVRIDRIVDALQSTWPVLWREIAPR